MSWSVVVLLLSGVPAGEEEKPTHFQNYTEAYRAAEEAQQPMLVILNPSHDAGEKPISLDVVRRTKQRRELLEKYIVVVIDTGTSHGKTVHELFGSEALPRLVIIDKTQEWQIYRSSEPLDGPQWTQILRTFQSGQTSTPLEVDQRCPT